MTPENAANLGHWLELDPELERAREVRKHLSNLRFKFLDRLTYRRPLWQSYLDGSLDLHLLVTLGGKDVIAWVHSPRSRDGDANGRSRNHLASDRVHDDKLAMLVLVGDTSEAARPLNSLVGLDLSDDPTLLRAYTIQVPPNLPGGVREPVSRDAATEALWTVFQRKLRASLAAGYDVDGVVERGPQVVDALPNPDPQIVLGVGRWRKLEEFFARPRIFVGPEKVTFLFKAGEQCVDVRSMFLCPGVPELGPKERVCLNHALTSARMPKVAQGDNRLFSARPF
jgi:hypothetical protein